MSNQQEIRKDNLSPERFIDRARISAGLSDFGGDGFYEPYCKLLECAAQDVDFHAQGLEAFQDGLVRWLVNRLRMQNDISRHPEILNEDVSDPMIVIGFGRSGTTKLHKMLSEPDSVHKTWFWRLWNPAPFPDAAPGLPDPRIGAAGSSQLLTEDKPALDAAHHMTANQTEEEWLVYEATFDNWVWPQMMPLPSYFDWVMPRSSMEPYRYVKTIFQYLQWQDGGKQDKPWVFKSVGHLADLDALMDCYPAATLVQPHRDPRETIPSYCKLLQALWPLMAKPTDPTFIGAEVLRMFASGAARYLDARDRLSLNDRILDVTYEQVRSDPMLIMAQVYERARRPMTLEAEQKMAGWHKSNEQGARGKHEYSLDEFGLTEAGIDRVFRDYIDRFIDR